MKKNILKKIWLAVFALFLVGTSLEVNAQGNAEAIQEIAAAYDLAIYNDGTFQSSSTLAKLNVELQNPTSKNHYAYFDAIKNAIQTQETTTENALVYQVYVIGTERNLSANAIKVLYEETVTMLQ